MSVINFLLYAKSSYISTLYHSLPLSSIVGGKASAREIGIILSNNDAEVNILLFFENLKNALVTTINSEAKNCLKKNCPDAFQHSSSSSASPFP